MHQRLSEYLLHLHCGTMGLAYTDTGEEVLVDLAAYLTVAQSPPWLDVTAPVLDKLRTVDDRAYTFLCGAVGTYFQSWELRQDSGSRAETSLRTSGPCWRHVRMRCLTTDAKGASTTRENAMSALRETEAQGTRSFTDVGTRSWA